MLLSEVIVCLREDHKKHIRDVLKLIEECFKVKAHAFKCQANIDLFYRQKVRWRGETVCLSLSYYAQ